MQCLVAAGFQIQREEEEEEKDGGGGGGGRTPSGAGQGATMIVGDEEEEEEGEMGIVLPGARVLVMIEPDMMVRQTEWTAWYDACKTVRDRLEEELTRVRRL